MSSSDDGRGDVSPKTTHLSDHKVDFDTDRHDGGFRPSQNHHIASPMELSRSRDYPVSNFGGSSFYVTSEDGKCGVVTSTTELSYQKYGYWLYDGDFVSSKSIDYSSKSHYNKYMSIY